MTIFDGDLVQPLEINAGAEARCRRAGEEARWRLDVYGILSSMGSGAEDFVEHVTGLGTRQQSDHEMWGRCY